METEDSDGMSSSSTREEKQFVVAPSINAAHGYSIVSFYLCRANEDDAVPKMDPGDAIRVARAIFPDERIVKHGNMELQYKMRWALIHDRERIKTMPLRLRKSNVEWFKQVMRKGYADITIIVKNGTFASPEVPAGMWPIFENYERLAKCSKLHILFEGTAGIRPPPAWPLSPEMSDTVTFSNGVGGHTINGKPMLDEFTARLEAFCRDRLNVKVMLVNSSQSVVRSYLVIKGLEPMYSRIGRLVVQATWELDQTKRANRGIPDPEPTVFNPFNRTERVQVFVAHDKTRSYGFASWEAVLGAIEIGGHYVLDHTLEHDDSMNFETDE